MIASQCEPSMIPVILISFLLLTVSQAEFLVGRLREGQYEHPALNGWLTPHRARARCERDRTCGGFTYKGFITNDHSQKFKIFFFHLVLNYEDGPEDWNWVTYKAERDHIVFLNKTDPRAELLLAGKQLPLEAAKVSLLVARWIRYSFSPACSSVVPVRDGNVSDWRKEMARPLWWVPPPSPPWRGAGPVTPPG